MTEHKFKTLIGVLTITPEIFEYNEENVEALVEYCKSIKFSDIHTIVLPEGVSFEFLPNPLIAEKISEMAYETLEKMLFKVIEYLFYNHIYTNTCSVDGEIPPKMENSKDLWNWLKNYMID
jgi:hypothetical protein